VEDLAERGRVEVDEETSRLDAVLRQMGKPTQEMSSAVENGLADLPVHGRADGYTDEAARFPVRKRDRLGPRGFGREISSGGTGAAMNISTAVI